MDLDAAIKRIGALERESADLKQRCLELEAGIVRVAAYLGVTHVLKGT